MKAAITNSRKDCDQLHSDLIQSKKVVKGKEKEIYELSKTLENKNNHISSLKQSNGDLKSDKSKLETKIRTLEKKNSKQAASIALQTAAPPGKVLSDFDSVATIYVVSSLNTKKSH